MHEEKPEFRRKDFPSAFYLCVPLKNSGMLRVVSTKLDTSFVA